MKKDYFSDVILIISETFYFEIYGRYWLDGKQNILTKHKKQNMDKNIF